MGDDALAAPPSEFGSLVEGGPGDDRLVGAVFDDELHGGDGDDELVAGGGGRLYGGRGDDRLTGSRGDDDLDGGEGADVLRGLGGVDELLDSEKVAARDVLDGGSARGRGGAPGEGDVLVSIRCRADARRCPRPPRLFASMATAIKGIATESDLKPAVWNRTLMKS